MKALTYTLAHPLNQFGLTLQDLPEPETRDTDLLVEIRAVGINPGEVFLREHQSAPPGGRLILGWEFAGIVAKVGSATQGFQIGDHVYGTGDMMRDGSWAESVAVDYRVTEHMPKGMSFTESASMPIGTLTAWEALFRDGNRLPANVNTVLVIGGAGGVGSMAIQILKATTRTAVISTASRPESEAWCREMGADVVINHSQNLRAQLDGAGIGQVDFILSTHGTQQRLAALAQIVRPYGYIAAIDAMGSLDIGPLFNRAIAFHPEMVFTRILNGYDVEGAADILRTAATLTHNQKLRPITTTTLHGLNPETMRRAHELVGRGNTVGKVVIEF